MDDARRRAEPEGLRKAFFLAYVLAPVSRTVLLKGTLSLVAIAFRPLAILSLDRMQLSRLQYIISRWEYLNDHALGEPRKVLPLTPLFFEECVVRDHRKDNRYLPFEARIRQLLFFPAFFAAVVAAGAAARVLLNGSKGQACLVSVAWLAALALPARHNRDVYSRRWFVIAAALIAAFVIADWLALPRFSIFDVIREAVKAPNEALKLTSAGRLDVPGSLTPALGGN